jgi:hypothetical protein
VLEVIWIDQIIGFTIASGSISPHYGAGTNHGTPAIKNRREDGRQYKNIARKGGRKSKVIEGRYENEPSKNTHDSKRNE